MKQYLTDSMSVCSNSDPTTTMHILSSFLAFVLETGYHVIHIALIFLVLCLRLSEPAFVDWCYHNC